MTVRGCLIFVLSLFFKTALCQTEKFSSRIFFPGSIGLNIPSGDEQTSMRSGFSLLTAIEYRPRYTNDIFFRFNFDAFSNKYNNPPYQLPTNVTNGKLNANFFLLGAGYRHSTGRYAVYGLVQPGFNMSNYTIASYNLTGVSLGNITRDHPALKLSMGIEYYLVPHFALVVEPGFYHLFDIRRRIIQNPDYISYNIGFTTTLF